MLVQHKEFYLELLELRSYLVRNQAIFFMYVFISFNSNKKCSYITEMRSRGCLSSG